MAAEHFEGAPMLSVWLGGCLDGSVAPDDLLDAVGDLSVSGAGIGSWQSLISLVGAARGAGATGCSLALPVPPVPRSSPRPPSTTGRPC